MMTTMGTIIQDAIRAQGLEPLEFLDNRVGRGWTLAQWPDGTWFAACPGASPQWWKGDGQWRVQSGNNMAILQAIENGPPVNYDQLPTGLPEDWFDRLKMRRPHA